MPGNTRLIDNPLPDFVEEYEDTVVGPMKQLVAKMLVTLGHVTGKGATVTEDDRKTYTKLHTELGEARDTWETKRKAVAAKADAIADDREYNRVMDALTALDVSLMQKVKELLPIHAALKKGGRRLKTKKGRRGTKGTRRGRRVQS
jgi:hypothetical protein